MPSRWDHTSAFAPAAFLAFAVASLALQALALARVEPDGPPEALADAVGSQRALVGASVATGTIAGLALLLLSEALARRLPALAQIARFAGGLWGVLWLAAATFSYAAMDLAGHFDHPAGAKTLLYASYAFMTSPGGAALGGVLALGVGRAARGRPGWPRWYARFSLVCGVLTLVGGASLALAFSGMLGLLFLPLWLAVTAFVLPRATWREGRTLTASSAR